MNEHEIYMAQRAYQSRVNHTRFRRKHMHIEKAERRIKNLRVHFHNVGTITNQVI